MTEKNPLDVDLELAPMDPRRAHDPNEEAHDWQWFMSSPRGRRILARLRKECGVGLSSFAGDGFTDYREGRRSIGLYAEQLALRFTPAAYTEMILEHNQ